MKNIIAGLALVILTTMVGCVPQPAVKVGGGESAIPEIVNGRHTGRIDVRGHVVNTGGGDAWNVVLWFKFFDDGELILENMLRLGDIGGGSTRDFSGTFYGPQVTGVFTWEYRIDWD